VDGTSCPTTSTEPENYGFPVPSASRWHFLCQIHVSISRRWMGLLSHHLHGTGKLRFPVPSASRWHILCQIHVLTPRVWHLGQTLQCRSGFSRDSFVPSLQRMSG
jgi:hypothetical protein